MNDIVEQLANYEAHFDQAVRRGFDLRSASSVPLIVATEEGDMIVMNGSEPETNGESPTGFGRSSWKLKSLAAAAAVLLIVGVLALVTNDDGSITTDGVADTAAVSTPASVSLDEGGPQSVIEAYEQAFNAGDIDGVMALFGQSSSMVGTGGFQFDGLEAIRAFHVEDIANGASTDALLFANIQVDGNVVTWDNRSTNRFDQDFCSAGLSAEIEDGVIVTWTWPGRPPTCAARVRTIEAFFEGYNSGDIDAMMESFSEDSVLVGHPFRSRVEGLDSIRSLHIDDRAAAADSDPYLIANVEVVGDTVTWDHRWINKAGTAWCSAGQSAVVEQDGVIVSWTWPAAKSGLCLRRSNVVEEFVVAFNNDNLDGVMERFSDESTIVGHPLASRAEGPVAIRSLFGADLAEAAEADALTISNVEVVGNTVTWDHRWTSNEGEEWCGVGHSALVRLGAIITWDWPDVALCD